MRIVIEVWQNNGSNDDFKVGFVSDYKKSVAICSNIKNYWIKACSLDTMPEAIDYLINTEGFSLVSKCYRYSNAHYTFVYDTEKDGAKVIDLKADGDKEQKS